MNVNLTKREEASDAEKMESPNPTVTFQLNILASKAAH